MMTLKRFRVTNFRSIMDSGWIDCDNVTSLVGINQAGKSNVILALWKLKPVRDGQIDLLHDMPTKEYSSWRSTPEDVVFISVDFEFDNALINKVVAPCKCDREVAAIVNIERRHDGRYDVSFPYYKNAHSINTASIIDSISMLIAIYHMLKEGAHFQDLGAEYYNQFNTERKINAYFKKLKTLDSQSPVVAVEQPA